MNLDEMMETLPQHDCISVDVDISKFFDKEPGKAVITFLEPTVDQFSRSARVGKQLGIRNVTWATETCNSVALLAGCHVAPKSPDTPPAVFYEKICNKNSPLFLHIQKQFTAAFPHIITSPASMEETKNAFGETEEANTPSTDFA